MNTRATRRTGGVEEDWAEGKKDIDTLIRQPIKSSTRWKGGNAGDKTKTNTKDKSILGFGDDIESNSELRDNVASKQRLDNSKNIRTPRYLASANKNNGKDDRNCYHSRSSSETDSEENDETKREGFSAKVCTPSSRAVDETRFFQADEYSETEDFVQKERDLKKFSALRPRKREEREFVSKQQQSKVAAKKELLLDTGNNGAFSDGEEEEQKIRSVRGNPSIPKFTVLALLLIVASLGVGMLVLKESPKRTPEKFQVINSFQDRFRKLPMLFSGQSMALWQRSQRILELQLKGANDNQQPAIILLTAARDAERVLYCLGNQLAKMYASTLNSTYTVISGLDMTSEDSEDVKMDIDQRLSAGFQANDKAAVLHRLELLPPGSLIILYKYCDHENAAFKNVALVLTVLLTNSTLKPDIELHELEETVYEFLKETFINQVKSRTSHNEMDVDKLGGVWSRISHVVLPVFPGKPNGKECEDSKAIP